MTSAASAAAPACSAAAAGSYVQHRHALTARIAHIEAGGAPRAHAHRGRSINMLIDRGEHVLSPAVAPVSTTSFACVRLCMLSRYLDALVQ